MPKLNVRKNDKVVVISGKEKGKQGKILKTFPEKQRVVVEGLHLTKRAVKPTQKSPQGGIITREGSVHVSNVMLVCPSCDAPMRVAAKETDEGKFIRTCRQCAAEIDKG